MKRTNNLYNVQVARYAWIAVEADSPQEAKEIARDTVLEDYLDDEAFEESEIAVDSCETYSNEIGDLYLKDDDYVITADGAMTVEEYCQQLEEEDEE